MFRKINIFLEQPFNKNIKYEIIPGKIEKRFKLDVFNQDIIITSFGIPYVELEEKNYYKKKPTFKYLHDCLPVNLLQVYATASSLKIIKSEAFSLCQKHREKILFINNEEQKIKLIKEFQISLYNNFKRINYDCYLPYKPNVFGKIQYCSEKNNKSGT